MRDDVAKKKKMDGGIFTTFRGDPVKTNLILPGIYTQNTSWTDTHTHLLPPNGDRSKRNKTNGHTNSIPHPPERRNSYHEYRGRKNRPSFNSSTGDESIEDDPASRSINLPFRGRLVPQSPDKHSRRRSSTRSRGSKKSSQCSECGRSRNDEVARQRSISSFSMEKKGKRKRRVDNKSIGTQTSGSLSESLRSSPMFQDGSGNENNSRSSLDTLKSQLSMMDDPYVSMFINALLEDRRLLENLTVAMKRQARDISENESRNESENVSNYELKDGFRNGSRNGSRTDLRDRTDDIPRNESRNGSMNGSHRGSVDSSTVVENSSYRSRLECQEVPINKLEIKPNEQQISGMK